MLANHRLPKRRCDRDIPAIVRLWLLRMSIDLGGVREWLKPHGITDDRVARALGLWRWVSGDGEAFDCVQVCDALRREHAAAERSAARMRIPAKLRRSADMLAAHAGLHAAEQRILEFACLVTQGALLELAMPRELTASRERIRAALATVLRLPVGQVGAALQPGSRLEQSGLVTLRMGGPNALSCRLAVPSGRFADGMLRGVADAAELLRGTVQRAPPSSFSVDDFSHVRERVKLLLAYLRQARATGQPGVNIFIYGVPGTGKTELARVVAAMSGCELLEIASEGECGELLDAEARLRALRVAQGFFSPHRTLLVFDEAEDVFNDISRFQVGRQDATRQHKAGINRMLESNRVPVLWLSNARIADPAFVRRFDIVFELPAPPRKQRERIVRRYCTDLVGADVARRLCDADQLVPAVISRAAHVVRSVQKTLGDQGPGDALERLVNDTLRAQGHVLTNTNGEAVLSGDYDPALIHADSDVSVIADGIRRCASARLCLYGPPGTGKTGFGRWLARELDRPLITRVASELLSRWVGGTEQNIARAFREAADDGAVLLIDEVDSFLRDRALPQQSWEVMMVNELLTQMETFSGVFIASTNRADGIDPAALRRFDLRIRFDYLRSDQAWRLFARLCDQLGLGAPTVDLRPQLARLQTLTPGDCAAVQRRARFQPIKDARTLLGALAKECAAKRRHSRPAGFLSNLGAPA